MPVPMRVRRLRRAQLARVRRNEDRIRQLRDKQKILEARTVMLKATTDDHETRIVALEP